MSESSDLTPNNLMNNTAESTQLQMTENENSSMNDARSSCSPSSFIDRVIRIAEQNIEAGGRPFACLVVDPTTNRILSETGNHVAQTCDPTAHAEVLAIRLAAETLKKQQSHIAANSLVGLDFYIMASPCPMCFGAMYLCAPRHVTFITTREAYSAYYTDPRKYIVFDKFYEEMTKDFSQRNLPTKQFMQETLQNEAIEIIKLWKEINRTADASTAAPFDPAVASESTILRQRTENNSLSAQWFRRVLELARLNVIQRHGRPFACVIACGNELIAESADQVDELCDPTAQAELQAIRAASQKLRTEHMHDVQIYTLAMPSPMSVAAMYYCSPSQMLFLVHPSQYESFYQVPAAPKIHKLLDLYREYGKSNENRIMKMNQTNDETARQQGLQVYRKWSEMNTETSTN